MGLQRTILRLSAPKIGSLNFHSIFGLIKRKSSIKKKLSTMTLHLINPKPNPNLRMGLIYFKSDMLKQANSRKKRF